MSKQKRSQSCWSQTQPAVELAKLCHVRVRSPRETVARALEGDYHPEHLFTLRQSLDGYRFHQRLIVDLDCEIAEPGRRMLSKLDSSLKGNHAWGTVASESDA